MEKLLKVDFFKTKKFQTKRDGLEFINNTPELLAKINELTERLNEANEIFINEYDDYFKQFDKERILFQNKKKQEKKELLNKQKEKDEKLKKEEIIKEYLKQKEKEEKQKNVEIQKENIKEKFIKEYDFFISKIKTFLEIPLKTRLASIGKSSKSDEPPVYLSPNNQKKVDQLNARINKLYNKIIEWNLIVYEIENE